MGNRLSTIRLACAAIGIFAFAAVFAASASDLLPAQLTTHLPSFRWAAGILAALIGASVSFTKWKNADANIHSQVLSASLFTSIAVFLSVPVQVQNNVTPEELKLIFSQNMSALVTRDQLNLEMQELADRLPLSSDATDTEGYVMIANGKFGEAIASIDTEIERAKSVLASLAMSYQLKGVALYMLGEYEAALESVEDSLRLNGNSYYAVMNKYSYLTLLGRHEEALEAAQTATQLHPHIQDGWFASGLAASQLGMSERAVEYYGKANQVDPRFYKVWNNLGIALNQLGSSQEAIQAYDRAIAISPTNYQAHVNKAHVLHELGDFRAAIAEFDKGIAADPDAYKIYDAWMGRGWAQRELDLYEDALDSFLTALAIHPDHIPAKYHRAHALAVLGRYCESMGIVSEYIETQPEGEYLDEFQYLADLVKSGTLECGLPARSGSADT